MADNPCRAIIRGIEGRPEINIRSGPGTGFDIAFRAKVGAVAEVLDAMPDAGENNFQGKIYQWLKLRFQDGRTGWGRDDLLDLAPGDCSAVGYPNLFVRSFAFALTRDESKRPAPAADPAATPAETEFPPAITQGSEIEAEPAPPVEPAPAGESVWVPAGEADAAPPPVEPAGESVWVPAGAEESAPPPVEEAPAPVEPEPAPVEQPPAPAGCVATIIGSRNLTNVRGGPNTRYNIVTRLPLGAQHPIREVRPQDGGDSKYRWMRLDIDGQVGWVREDLLSYAGEACASLGLTPGLYPAPMALGKYWWVRGFVGPLPDHNGWDLGAAQGEPVLAGPQGGVVITSFHADKATPAQPRTLDHGYSLADPRIFNDPGWGFGYGHYVIVRYLHTILPKATQLELKAQKLEGAHLFAMYAHLHTHDVQAGHTLQPGEQIGTCGTTGNSEAPHVHLEVRASTNPNETQWARMKSGLVNPGVLFGR